MVAIAQLVEPRIVIPVDEKVAKKHGTEEVAKAYLQHLYSKEGQRIAAKNYYRPIDPEVAKESAKNFAPVKLFTIRALKGDWKTAQKRHFATGGTFDQLYKPGQ